ncbi:putative dual specificity tyrosine-phosphorylation-regulated kinase 3-like protein [Fragariocoptes setiger]|uniref:dual-specificity kinase n=1 Tax=Fragariocoptes setiger TaxID=1670756 RepID=A0ABQ7S6Y2_9ACAR|nr:putative dual specificity tyrosine-phosphorylation-regulated kinase 3-like protein [Fragariocoptes setiger]
MKQEHINQRTTATSEAIIDDINRCKIIEDLNSRTTRLSTKNSDSMANKVNVTNPVTNNATITITTTATNNTNSNNKERRDEEPIVVSPAQVIDVYHFRLTQYELQEIYNYPEIYFIGSNQNKRRERLHNANSRNFGYDDSSGSYIHVAHDHIAYRYEMLKVIGKGSFGSVVKAFDHKTMQNVALKMVRNERRFHQQAQEEIKILDHLRRRDVNNNMNVVHMFDHFVFRNHTCITFELLSLNLYELTRKNGFVGFSIHLVRRFAYSLLKCLEALYENKIIHCDLKPENVLLKQQSRSGIKVIDFGSSCFENRRIHTYIQSRFYRSPETILGAKYGMAIDMWSLGCILVELVTGKPLFPGEDENDQLACIIELLGMPPKSLLNQAKPLCVKKHITSKGYPRYCITQISPSGQVILLSGKSKRGNVRGPPNSKTLSSILHDSADSQFIDFLRRCLEWDPEIRMTPAAAMRHPWLVRRKLPLPPKVTTTNSDLHPSLVSCSLKAAPVPVQVPNGNSVVANHDTYNLSNGTQPKKSVPYVTNHGCTMTGKSSATLSGGSPPSSSSSSSVTQPSKSSSGKNSGSTSGISSGEHHLIASNSGGFSLSATNGSSQGNLEVQPNMSYRKASNPSITATPNWSPQSTLTANSQPYSSQSATTSPARTNIKIMNSKQKSINNNTDPSDFAPLTPQNHRANAKNHAQEQQKIPHDALLMNTKRYLSSKLKSCEKTSGFNSIAIRERSEKLIKPRLIGLEGYPQTSFFSQNRADLLEV